MQHLIFNEIIINYLFFFNINKVLKKLKKFINFIKILEISMQ